MYAEALRAPVPSTVLQIIMTIGVLEGLSNSYCPGLLQGTVNLRKLSMPPCRNGCPTLRNQLFEASSDKQTSAPGPAM